MPRCPNCGHEWEDKPDLRRKDIQHILDRFQELFGNPKNSRWDRFAAKRLVEKFGEENVIKVIEALGATKDEQYAPSVYSVQQLENKWLAVGEHLKRQAEGSVIVE